MVEKSSIVVLKLCAWSPKNLGERARVLRLLLQAHFSMYGQIHQFSLGLYCEGNTCCSFNTVLYSGLSRWSSVWYKNMQSILHYPQDNLPGESQILLSFSLPLLHLCARLNHFLALNLLPTLPPPPQSQWVFLVSACKELGAVAVIRIRSGSDR